MKREQKRINVLNVFFLYFLNIVFLSPTIVYGGQNFSIDSYGIALDYNGHIDAFIGSFRWFGAFLYKAYYSIFQHNPILDSTIDCIVFIVLVAGIVSLLSYTLYKLINKKSILSYISINLSVLVSVLNAWFCNILSFPECVFITAIGTVLCFSALIVFIKKQNLYGYILSSILIILATGIYQQFLFVFTIFIVAICECKVLQGNQKTFKQLFSIYIKPVILIIVSGGIYLIIGKIIQMAFNITPNERVALSIPSIIKNCFYFATHQHSYLKGRGLFSSEILTVCFLVVGFVWFLCAFIDWLKNKNTLKTIIIYSSFVCAYISAYIPGILSTSHAARAMFALFSVFALFTIGTLILSESKLIKTAFCIILSIVLISNIFVFVKGEINLKKQNDIDGIWCEQVIEEIEKYEKVEQEIKQIYYCYDDKTDIAEYSESAVCHTYSLRSMINYYSNRDFKVIKMPEETKNSYFKDKNWDDINIKEQLIFVEDTLYLCCY